MFIGKTALVTGSTSGIGLGIAQTLAAQGASVILNGFGDATEIERLRAGMAERHGVQVRFDAADMGKPEAIEAMMGKALAEFGCIDLLINKPASSTSRRSRISPSTSGTRSSRSTCRRAFTPCGWRCRR
jgi:NAD(P)-dependent dehydrogenase (short-subunit alcohol dehydrogenase family)